ncbi:MULTISPECIES: flagellar basal body rod protein FlgB [Methylobacterium]|uniref:flagellar basal body rod protein FlgB n=1 Tax=Methylobacterium TaxID=407 RepID=UPI0008DFA2A8|nr:MULTISPECIES: flagellar basal body rod protein FlgB [Methylobacterium]MBZ6415291.1 flagellar basal body rod protein FlgB [Methylobacterium sp.]MBK3396167.1 flagellar basal body rod protein FlgB [Methylobacterium ajmalii]MBK3406791.1 flagellar basal body rod protein FlgB [Methylobacterium ajmalii]MBK3425624.1 flagellar basal body rod protein FlgB [Methylobacterium ajmalii]SFE80480.1 flagellar basal-body rod protein FlgB [Methylobacterium sp. yr596]
MSVTDLPIVAMLRNRMQWQQTRQKVLAENVANADTPGFRARELKAPRFQLDGSVAAAGLPGIGLERTSGVHLAGTGQAASSEERTGTRFEMMPSGNAVSLEDEMLKAADNQGDYQLASLLYRKSLQTLRTAVGR